MPEPRQIGDVDVSVVVPVYNPGKFVEDCIDGLLTQTMDPARFEVVFVDDGSTDETPARLDQLAAEHSNIRVFHEPGSGWSGRPRNVGTDNSYGRYVFYCDHDDWLSPEALERMVAYADENQADVLLPKMVGHKRGVPSLLYSENRPTATVWTAPLMTSLTPHKLFRRAFLDEIGLRFPEGRRRLEDHVFVTEAYFRASNISVLSDYPCYHHISRDDTGNAGLAQVEPVGYYGYVREVLDVIDRYTEPGPQRDAVRGRSFTHEIIGRLKRSRSYEQQPEAYRTLLFNEARRLIQERYPDPEFDARFPLAMRERARAIRANDPETLHDINGQTRKFSIKPELTGIEWQGDAWVATIHADPLYDSKPIRFLPHQPRGWTVDPRILPKGRAAEAPVLKKEVVGGKVWIIVTDRLTDVEWFAPTDIKAELVPIGDGTRAHRISLDGTVRFDPGVLAGGGELTSGLWDIALRFASCGFDMRAKVTGSPKRLLMPRPLNFGVRPTAATVYLTDRAHTLAIDVGQRKSTLIAEAVRLGVGPASQSADGWVVQVPVDIGPGAAARKVPVALLGRLSQVSGEVSGRLVAGADGAQLEIPATVKIKRGRRDRLRRKYSIGLRPKAKSDPIKIGTATVDHSGAISSITLSGGATD